MNIGIFERRSTQTGNRNQRVVDGNGYLTVAPLTILWTVIGSCYKVLSSIFLDHELCTINGVTIAHC